MRDTEAAGRSLAYSVIESLRPPRAVPQPIAELAARRPAIACGGLEVIGLRSSIAKRIRIGENPSRGLDGVSLLRHAPV